MIVKKVTDRKVRSLGAQVDRMKHVWPTFGHRLFSDGLSIWIGKIRPYQASYKISIFWKAGSSQKPWVSLLAPELTPRKGGSYEEIPHLLYYEKDPKLSGLCLFDPDKKEWSNKQLIADTTMFWALEWLQHYEFWHYDGIWRGKSIGPESIAELRASTFYRQESEFTQTAT